MANFVVIGLGAMGLNMARNMHNAGLSITGVDLSDERAALFRDAGGATAASFAEVAAETAVVFVMVNEAAHMESALFTDNAVKKMISGSVVVSTSTVPPSYITELDARLQALGLGLVDTPVSGGEKGAHDGSLTLMLSGRPGDVAKIQPALDAVSAKIYTIADLPGMGSKVKVVHQHLASTHIALAVEAMGLCAKSGIDPAEFYEIVTNSAGNSKLFEYFVPFLLNNDYFPYSSINTSEKDLRLVVELADELDYPADIARSAYEQFLRAKEAGMGAESSIATIKMFPVQWKGAQLKKKGE